LTGPGYAPSLVRVRSIRAPILIAVAAAVVGGGCSSSPAPHGPDAPPGSSSPVDVGDTQHLVVGGADSVGSIPGTPGARYVYVFRQVDPANDRFTFQDRDLSFYFRPSPTVLHFQVENRQDRPVWIEWDRSTFLDAFGTSKRLANSETRWSQRLTPMAPTQIIGLMRYGNYVIPLDLLVDPGPSTDQLHRPLFPEDQTAPQYVDREFGVTLVFRFQDRLQPYAFRFKVRSVVPR
jgi:hypothetical protein